MIQLVQSPVVFNEEHHRYQLGDKRLLGITGLIHAILELGVYPDASDYVKKVAIPRAGEYGSCVHKAIEIYDQIAIKQTVYPNTFYEYDHRGSENWDVSTELENYIKHRTGFLPLANEYTISDLDRWASNIDNVWVHKQTGGIWLVDTKTNNLDLYPLDGYGHPNYFNDRADGLKEYLSWQLSIYAELFEKQNPGLKVEGLACNWLRRDDAAFWIIERKSSDLVHNLLLTSYEFGEDGEPHYSHPNPEALKGGLPIPKETKLIIPEDAIRFIYTVQKQADEAKVKLEEMKAQLRTAMEKEGIKSWDSGLFKVTIAADSKRSSFDSTAFKKDHPVLYTQYTTQKTTKGGFTIKLKDND